MMQQEGVATLLCANPACRRPFVGRPDKVHCSAACRNEHWRLDHPRRGTDEEQLAMDLSGNGNPSIQAQFECWRRENPETWDLVRRYAYEALHAGRQRFGIAAIVERVRWHHEIEARNHEPFKLNNNYRSRMVRRLIQEDSRFEDLFEVRELKSA